MTNFSIASLASLQPQQRAKVIRSLSPGEAEELLYCWRVWARPDQLAPPGDWRTWLITAGRGWGKTRTGAEWVGERVDQGFRRIALVARTAADVRDVIVEGESGILATSPPDRRPRYEPSKRRLTWPNGAIATTYSADEPNALRGPQHDTAWADEIASWQYPDTWDQLQFGLRLGKDPRSIITTTPRPTPIIKGLIADPTTHVTRGSTFDNKANLAKAFLEKIVAKYEGTRLGRQEIFAEILIDNPGALWKRDNIDATRVTRHPNLRRIIVAVDPAVSSNANSAETGIIVAGLGDDGQGYVLADCSLADTPAKWGAAVVTAYHLHQANGVVAEVNQGGALVEANLKAAANQNRGTATFDVNGARVRPPDPIPYRPVHASRGKQTRAEPIAALYEQGRIHHVGTFAKLEDQMADWDPTGGAPSPDRLDALVWAMTDLMLDRTIKPVTSLPDIETRNFDNEGVGFG